MDMTQIDPVREELMKQNPTFRELMQKHNNYEKRLTELAGLNYPNEEELLEESALKKKKLAVKDRLFAIMEDFSTNAKVSH